MLQKMIDTNQDYIRDKILNATVLLAPHHGRTGEFCEGFFRIVNPILSVISDKEIVHLTQEESSSLYKGRGVKLYGQDRYVLTTRNDGNITFEVTIEQCIVSMNKENY
jgi:beta-lactamase superfamily II metal-dependent hydrolase